jgi:hypothetical protein
MEENREELRRKNYEMLRGKTLDLIYGPVADIKERYGREPGREIMNFFVNLVEQNKMDKEKEELLYSKVENYSRKLCMMDFAGEQAIVAERDFISTQNRECPSLIWEDEIKILYHLESMILFGRSALDIASYFFSSFLIKPYGKKRLDSFNKLSKYIEKSNDESLLKLKQLLKDLGQDDFSTYRLLCGSERGRSLRDTIAHQTIIRIEYLETKENSEKEYCHVIINHVPIPLKLFISKICLEVMYIFFTIEDLIIDIHKTDK